MTASYIPMILSEGLAADGEALQLLSIENSTPAAVVKATGVNASPGRAGKMKIAFLLQWDGNGPVSPDDIITLRLRSPYAGDAGEQNHRPVVKITPASPIGVLGAPVGGVPGNPPAPVALDFSPTFNSKLIPNWGVQIQVLGGEEGTAACYVEIDFGHTIQN